MEAWQSLLLAFGGNAALLAVLAFVCKSFLEKLIFRDTKQFEFELKAKSDSAIEHLKNELQVKIETYKAAIKAQGDAALEQLKSSLAIEANQRNATLGSLLQRRFEAIAEIYAPLRTFVEAASDYARPFESAGEDSREERSKRVAATQKEFRDAFHKHAIFLSFSSSDRITKIEKQIIGAANLYLYSVQIAAKSPAGVNTENWMKAHQTIEHDVRFALKELEIELRTLMGDDVKHDSLPTT